jgi:hypothetical protein
LTELLRQRLASESRSSLSRSPMMTMVGIVLAASCDNHRKD